MKSLYSVMLLLFLLASCQTKENKDKEEENIIIALLPTLIDTACMDLRVYEFRPPVPKSIYDKNHKFIRFDYSDLAKDSIIFKKRLDSLDKDTSTLYVEFNPVLEDVNEKYKKELFTHFKIKKENGERRNESLTILHQNFRTKKKFRLRNSLKMPKINKDDGVFSKYGSSFSGSFAISRIYFDKKRNFGVLTAAYYCGSRCGEGFTIFIKKRNEKWIIDQIQDTWIA